MRVFPVLLVLLTSATLLAPAASASPPCAVDLGYYSVCHDVSIATYGTVTEGASDVAILLGAAYVETNGTATIVPNGPSAVNQMLVVRFISVGSIEEVSLGVHFETPAALRGAVAEVCAGGTLVASRCYSTGMLPVP